jgi:hypothetical protein
MEIKNFNNDNQRIFKRKGQTAVLFEKRMEYNISILACYIVSSAINKSAYTI